MSDTSPWATVRHAHHGSRHTGYGIADVDRPQPRMPIDPELLAEFNAGTERAIEANRGREERERHTEYCRALRART